MPFVKVEHPRIRRAEREIFFASFVPDCMQHQCRCVGPDPTERSGRADGIKLDACCQYGVDLGIGERDRILAQQETIAQVLDPGYRDRSLWFDDSEPEHDESFPSGMVIRTAVAGEDEASGCVFLQHAQRGCALHRVALDQGVDPVALKPVVCSLYPISFDSEGICLSPDFRHYSCAGPAGGPTVYRVVRETIGQIFGSEALPPLDRVEQRLLENGLPTGSAC